MNRTTFLQDVYSVVAAIPEGCVVTYGQIASLVGRPQCSRMVGQAMHNVPEELHLPCHRVVNSRGRYIGGSIMPGVKLALDALSKNAALLPHIELAAPQKVISGNTVDSMKSGIIYGSAGRVDGIIDKFTEELGGEATIVATGDAAPAVIPYCKNKILIDETLHLKGLYYIYKRNTD